MRSRAAVSWFLIAVNISSSTCRIACRVWATFSGSPGLFDAADVGIGHAIRTNNNNIPNFNRGIIHSPDGPVIEQISLTADDARYQKMALVAVRRLFQRFLLAEARLDFIVARDERSLDLPRA